MGGRVTGDASRRARVTAVVFLIVALGASCGERVPEEYRGFFALRPEEQKDSILLYPLDTQIAVYLVGMRAMRPPVSYLADAIATNGQPAVPVILQRLRTANDGFGRSDLILILESMVCFQGVDLRTNAQAMEVISSVTATMKVEAARATAEAMVKTIKDGCVEKRARAKDRFRGLRMRSDS
jgi:hypothetical protein